MYFSKRNEEVVVQEETPIWMCTTNECSSWMRENFSFIEKPLCPLCKSEMVKQMKMLPCLANNTKKISTH